MLKIIQVGKSRDFAEVEAKFLKMLGQFAKVEVIRLAEKKASKTFPVERCVEEEGEMILKAMEGDEFVVALDELGDQLSSVEFGEFLGRRPKITFVIGGAFGLSAAVKASSHKTLSFSKMTFTHQMVRVFLLEQIYRGFCILKGKEYHH